MANELTTEEQRAWDIVERRAERFVQCMERVAEAPEGTRDDACNGCGYPYLYYDRDLADDCVICGWNNILEIFQEPGPGGEPLTEAQGRLNFVTSGCATPRFASHSARLRFPTEWQALTDALDALAADDDPANDRAHWQKIRHAFDFLADLVWPQPNRMWRFQWKFAAKAFS